MEMDHRDSDLEGTIPHQGCREMYFLDKKSTLFTQGSAAELSETEEDGREPGRPPTVDNGTAEQPVKKIKLEREETKPPAPGPPTFTLPVAFPFPHPFLPPAPAYPPQPANSSASSHSSESSSGSQQTWSFEEQFKQVRQWHSMNYLPVVQEADEQRYLASAQPVNAAEELERTAAISKGPTEEDKDFQKKAALLYEISDDPKRKEFLDDLFGFMQRRGTPINRLPIMAKSVLDLFELYNLVIQRGGLVDVINKKLWQEIIKGLHLPSSITSAAFTLRTQYMKYLYPYECEKRRLSTPGELQAAIDGNRREGRRGSYGAYGDMRDMIQRSPQNSPISLVTGGSRPTPVNGAANHLIHHHNNNHIPPQHALMPANMSSGSGMMPADIEYRMVEYVKLLNKEFRASTTTSPVLKQNSPPESPSEGPAVAPLEMSRFALWNLYNNTSPPQDMQKEALNLEKREEDSPQPPPAKRHYPENDDANSSGTHIKISSRGEGRGPENSIVVSMDINGTMYQGVLFAQNSRSNRLQS